MEKTESKANTLAKVIGRNVKAARIRLGITQSQLAEQLGLESLTISRLETGAQMPAVGRLGEIATLLQTSLPVLVSDTNENDAFAGLLAEVIKDLPLREKEFVYAFAVQYAQHWRAANRA